MVKCLSCGGVYEPVLADGMLYFHACPPFSARELRAAVAAGTVRLTGTQQAALDAAEKRDQDKLPAPDVETQADQVFASFVVRRPGHRDENIDVDKAQAARDADGTLKRGRTAADLMKAPGAGIVDLDRP